MKMERLKPSYYIRKWKLNERGPTYFFHTTILIIALGLFGTNIYINTKISKTVIDQTDNDPVLLSHIPLAVGGIELGMFFAIIYYYGRKKKDQATTVILPEEISNQLRTESKELEYQSGDRAKDLTQANLLLRLEIKRRAQAEEQALEKERQYQELLENIELGITRIDLDLNIVTANSALGRILDCPADELIGQKCYTVYRQNDGLCSDCPGMKAMTTHRPVETDFHVISRNNKKHPCQISTFPSTDNDGLIDGFVMVMKNMGALEEASHKLNEVNRELNVKRLALKEKSVVLDGILGQVENDKNRLKSQINSNMDKIVTPILHILRERTGPQNQNFISLLDSCIRDITSPFINKLESNYNRLSLREIEICNMVKNGLSTKDISRTLNTSNETVRKQRLQIRKKLGLTGRDINLAGYLRSL